MKSMMARSVALPTWIKLIATCLLVFASPAMAEHALPWQLGLPEPASVTMSKLNDFHNLLLIIIYAISALVFFLLTYVCIRFHHKANPVPSKVSHNKMLEVIWTLIPIVILLVIAVPSFKILYYMDRNDKAEMTLKIVGHQWYWHYQYPDHGNFEFDSYMVKDEDIKPGELRLLEVDNPIVLPVNTPIRLLITAADVMHSWAIPAFGIKRDAVPGRTNETALTISKPGTYYGQCSELCGYGHGFMPIKVIAVSKEEFEKWVAEAKIKYASTLNPHRKNFALVHAQ